MKKLEDKDIYEYLDKHLSEWEFNYNKVIRHYNTKNWLNSMLISNMISYLAEKNNHHPELTINYNKVIITLTTHDVGNNVSIKDLQLAKQIEENIFSPL